MINVQFHLDELDDRISAILKLIDATHPDSSSSGVSRETRGLAIVLLYASYENLLTGLTRTLLEAASRCRVSNKRLRPGFRLFTVDSSVRSLRDVSERKVYASALPQLIAQASSGSVPSTINTNAFPYDGSFFKRSQISLWCSTFEIPNPISLLANIWGEIDTIVADRNGIAHGRLTPDEVGRRYTETDIRTLISDWRSDWSSFLVEVQRLASSRDFFRLPR